MADSYSDPVIAWPEDETDIRFIIAFDVLQIFGLVSLTAILCTASFSSRIRRSTAWYLFNSAWAFSCASYLLILGNQTGSSPGHVICLCQAMLIHACPVLSVLTFDLLTLEIFLSISDLPSISRIAMIFLYLVPYIVFVGVLIIVLVLGLLNPTTILREPAGLFCYVSTRLPSHITSFIAICAVIASLMMGVYIAIKFYQCWSVCKSLLIHNKTPFALVLRVALIGFCSLLSIGLAIIDIFKSNPKFLTEWRHLSLAVLSAAVGIIFGSQGDILRVWMFWRKIPETPPTSVVHTITASDEFEDDTTRTEP